LSADAIVQGIAFWAADSDASVVVLLVFESLRTAVTHALISDLVVEFRTAVLGADSIFEGERCRAGGSDT
jgi:hypothetical protein